MFRACLLDFCGWLAQRIPLYGCLCNRIYHLCLIRFSFHVIALSVTHVHVEDWEVYLCFVETIFCS